VDVLVFLMIGWLDKLDALCAYITNCGDDCNDVGRWNEDIPCVVIQNMGGAKEADILTGQLNKQVVCNLVMLIKSILSGNVNKYKNHSYSAVETTQIDAR
jgi:hypothetical protein